MVLGARCESTPARTEASTSGHPETRTPLPRPASSILSEPPRSGWTRSSLLAPLVPGRTRLAVGGEVPRRLGPADRGIAAPPSAARVPRIKEDRGLAVMWAHSPFELRRSRTPHHLILLEDIRGSLRGPPTWFAPRDFGRRDVADCPSGPRDGFLYAGGLFARR
jgi:hypothetical protein